MLTAVKKSMTIKPGPEDISSDRKISIRKTHTAIAHGSRNTPWNMAPGIKIPAAQPRAVRNMVWMIKPVARVTNNILFLLITTETKLRTYNAKEIYSRY